MAIPIEMPKLSDTMQEGVVVAWLAEEGQKVAAGDVIAQVETDKATMDLEIYDDGVLLKRVVDEGLKTDGVATFWNFNRILSLLISKSAKNSLAL